MNVHLKDRGKTLMDMEREYKPNRFWSAYIPPRLIPHDLIMIVLETERCLVSSLIYIFVYICCPLILGKRTKEEASEVFCVGCSVVWYREFDTRTEWANTTGSISDADMEKDGACKMNRQSKKCSCARNSGCVNCWIEVLRRTESDNVSKTSCWGPMGFC